MLHNQRRRRAQILLAAAAFIGLSLLFAVLLPQPPAAAQTEPLASTGPTKFQARTLLITAPKVIDDPKRTSNPCVESPSLKPWSFGTLMKEIAAAESENAAVDFINNWLGQYGPIAPVNGQTVSPRDIKKITDGWAKKGGDLPHAPFRLLAIANRIDLLRSPLLAGENAGEVRFVFGAIDVSDACTPLNFTVILEYGVRKSSCDQLQKWAKRWVKLANHEPGSDDYNEILWPLTDSVTKNDSNRAKPNGSAIDHVRTNEIVRLKPEEVLKASDWELREFRLDPSTGQLKQDTVTMSPWEALNGKIDPDGRFPLDDFLKSIDRQIAAQDYWIPPVFPTPPHRPLLGAVATGGMQWRQSDDFAKNTCGGCHGGIVSPDVTHIDPIHGTPSGFLVNTELPRREGILRTLADNGCKVPLDGKILRLVH